MSGIVLAQSSFDSNKKRIPFVEPLVLKSQVVRAASLGLNNAAADLSWLAAIQYMGGSASKTSEKLTDYLFLSAELDPKFAYPYAFGALIMPAFNQTEAAIKLSEKGIKDALPDWRIPYYLATTYHMNLTDSTNAAKYFDLAARTPGAPPNIKIVAATYGSRPDLRERTKAIWIGILETSNDEMVIEQAKRYITHYEILDLLEKAAAEYKTRNSKFPDTPEDLVKANILRAVPPDPFGFEYAFDLINGRANVKN
jgi:hypothetical protein